MKGDTDTIKKFIQILINLQGAEEATEASKTFYDTQSKGVQGAKKDAEDAAPKIEDFLKRWKYELMLVGGAVTAIYATIRYSSVAHTMMDLLGRSIGFVADVILIRLLPYLMVVVGWFIELGKALNDLPDGFKDMIAFAILGATALWGLHKALVAAGIAGGALGLVLGALAGLVIGIEVVLLLREMGAFKAISDWAGDVTAMLRSRLDQFSIDWHNFWIDSFLWFSNLWNETLGKLPGMPKAATKEDLDKLPTTAHWGDMYDLQAAEAYDQVLRKYGVKKAVELWGGDRWKETAEQWRQQGTPEAEAGRWTYKPLTDEDLDRMPGDQAFLRFGKWLQGETGERKEAGGLPSTSAFDFEEYYRKAYPSAPNLTSESSPPGGTTPAAAKTQPPQVIINHAEIHLDPNDLNNKGFFEQIAQMTNKTNALGIKRVNTYG